MEKGHDISLTSISQITSILSYFYPFIIQSLICLFTLDVYMTVPFLTPKIFRIKDTNRFLSFALSRNVILKKLVLTNINLFLLLQRIVIASIWGLSRLLVCWSLPLLFVYPAFASFYQVPIRFFVMLLNISIITTLSLFIIESFVTVPYSTLKLFKNKPRFVSLVTTLIWNVTNLFVCWVFILWDSSYLGRVIALMFITKTVLGFLYLAMAVSWMTNAERKVFAIQLDLVFHFNAILKEIAYIRCTMYNQTKCHISLDPFDGEDESHQSLLHCGHRFFTEHLEKYEEVCDLADKDKPVRSCHRCPVCRARYPAHWKYDYNPYFYDDESIFYDNTWYKHVTDFV
eukprot:59933_1